jgi:hypothetical protein
MSRNAPASMADTDRAQLIDQFLKWVNQLRAAK